MRIGEQAGERDDRVPRLVCGLDPTSLTLTPDEGFLLSRIDGVTTCRELRQIGGLPPAEVDRCLDRWLDDGLITLDGEAGSQAEGRTEATRSAGTEATQNSGAEATPSAGAESESSGACDEGAKPQADAPPATEETSSPGGSGAIAVVEPSAQLDLPEVDPSLDLAEDVQKRVLEMALRLDRPYHELLGVAPEADTREVKKAYFKLSKVFHPDRYFRRNLGEFEELVERCFKRILEAYELLSDPMTRGEVQAQARSALAEEVGEAARSAKSDPARMRRRLDQLSGQGKLRAERRRKAKGLFESGMAAFGEDRWLEAAGSVRLAIAFDPKNEAYRERFVEVQRQAHGELSKAALKKAEAALEMRDYEEALGHFEEAVTYRPADAELHARAARVAWQGVGELRKAKELACAAVELAPEIAANHRVLGQVYAAAGLGANAKRELKIALEMDPDDAEARAALRGL